MPNFEKIIDTEWFSRSWKILVVLVILYLVKHLFNKLITAKISDNTHKYKTRKTINFFVFTLFMISLLFIFNDKLGNVGLALGVAGAGIAFALQEVIISVAGWLNIVFTNKVAVGQRVLIGNVKGDVIDIGVMTTTIMEIGDWVEGDLYNGRIVSIANSYIFKETVHNYSSEYPFLWDEINIPIRTESDYKKAKQVFQTVLNDICGEFSASSKNHWAQLSNKYRIEDAAIDPMVTLSFDENWITFKLRYIVDYKSRRSVKDKIFTRILDEVARHNDIIFIATSTLEVTNVMSDEEPTN